MSSEDKNGEVEVSEPTKEIDSLAIEDEDDNDDDSNLTDAAAKKKRDKKKKAKEKAKEKAKDKKQKEKKETPAEARARFIREEQARIAAEEERLKREAEEKFKKAEEARLARIKAEEEAERRKQEKKQREKEKRERLKREGKLLTEKQKQDKIRFEMMLKERQKQFGSDVTAAGAQKSMKEKFKKKPKPELKVEAEPTKTPEEEEKDSWDKDSEDEVKGKWDDTTDEEEEEVETSESQNKAGNSQPAASDATDLGDDVLVSDSDSGLSSAEDASMAPSDRISLRHKRAEAKRLETEPGQTLYRAAITCVLGHVDTGKTSLLDKLRRSHVQAGEAGGITQQIGGTNVPIESLGEMAGEQLREQLRLGFSNENQQQSGVISAKLAQLGQLPGIMFIDTPGHESFTNLRMRGSSLCDVAVLVVDLMHGLEPQTIESLRIIRKRKVPFVIAFNKVDRLYGWKSTGSRTDIMKSINSQQLPVQQEFDDRANQVIVELASEASLNARLYNSLTDEQLTEDYVPCVPTSAIQGDGLGSLIAQLVRLCRVLPSLSKRLRFSNETQCSILEVKAVPGLGSIMDVLLVNGRLRIGNTVLVPTVEGAVEAVIRELLTPQPNRELRVKSSRYSRHHRVKGATALRVVLRGDAAEKALAGLPLCVLRRPDEVEEIRKDIQANLDAALAEMKMKKSDIGVSVQASTLGALEALLTYLRTEKVTFADIAVGPVHRRDVMRCSAMLERDPQYAVILAFDVRIESDARQLADSLGVRIFEADIIYHLTDKFSQYRDEHKKRKQAEMKPIAVFPVKLKILPEFIFNSRDPIVMGVRVEAGRLVEGTPISTSTTERPFIELGRVTSIEANHKQIPFARPPLEVCIKVEPTGGEGGPKMYGRHFDEKDILVSKVNRESIDAVKEWFRDDMQRSDWELMIELKKLFGVM